MATASSNPENKNKFQISNEVKDSFVTGIAESMLKLSKDKQLIIKYDTEQTAVYPTELHDALYSPVSGFSYTGVNMARLMLSSMEKNYTDNRWVTFKQLQSMKDNNPELDIKIRQGEKGVKVLGSQQIKFIAKENEEWEFPTDERIKELHNLQKQGVETPEINKTLLFYPFTVFNAEQIEGFPAKENSALKQTSIEQDNLDPFDLRLEQLDKIDAFISSAGVRVKHHNENDSSYYPEQDIIKMPQFPNFVNVDAYTATKLRLFYAATGHKERENRRSESITYEGVAFEDMRGDMFSMLVSARYGLPMPQKNSLPQMDNWNKKFAGGDTKNLFRAISDAAKMITAMNQYELGEQPQVKWFPKKEEWNELNLRAQGNHPDDIAKRQQRDAEIVQANAQKVEEIKVCQDKIAIEAQQRWAGLPEVQRKHGCLIEKVEKSHLYLVNKGIQAFGLKQISYRHDPNDVLLMVPMQNIDGEIRGLQFISDDGEMGFLESHALDKSGIFHLIDSVNSPKVLTRAEILICEDYATGASLHMATKKPVIVAFDVYNFEAVAKQIREKYPDAKITICAANDLVDGPESYKTGKAEFVASEVNCKVIIPNLSENDIKLGLSTFNDIHKMHGLEALQKQITKLNQNSSQNASNSMSREEMDKAQAKDMQEIEQANKIREVLNNPELLNQALAQLKNNPNTADNISPELTAPLEQRSPRVRM